MPNWLISAIMGGPKPRLSVLILSRIPPLLHQPSCHNLFLESDRVWKCVTLYRMTLKYFQSQLHVKDSSELCQLFYKRIKEENLDLFFMYFTHTGRCKRHYYMTVMLLNTKDMYFNEKILKHSITFVLILSSIRSAIYSCPVCSLHKSTFPKK